MPRTRIAVLVVASISAVGCGAILGIPHASKADRARIHQYVGPVSQRAVPLREALRVVAESASLPVTIDICASLAEVPVTIVTTQHQELGTLVQAAAFQVGAPVRLFMGHHGEIARPTLFCPQHDVELLTVQSSGGRGAVEQPHAADGASRRPLW